MKRAWLLALLVSACNPGDEASPDSPVVQQDAGVDAATSPPDAFEGCLIGADEDGDGIKNGIEGCEEEPARDTDGDGTPDWQDEDSDGDGLGDRYEDRNGDGLLGECTTACAGPGDCQAGEICATGDDGLSPGVCVSWACLDGETDPHAADSDGDGEPDVAEGVWICNPPEELTPGLKPCQTVDSASVIDYSSPSWRFAAEVDAVGGPVRLIGGAEPVESAYIIDLDDPSIEVAGFLVSKGATPATTGATAGALDASQRLAPGALAGVSQLVQRASGTRGTSLDGYDTVLGTTLVLTTGTTSATALREEVVRALLGRAPSSVSFPPVSWTGATGTGWVVVFQTVFRHDTSQILYMGAVVAREDFDDDSRSTGFHADDLSNGTGLTRSLSTETAECEFFRVDTPPAADIIWVLDESGSMSDDLANVSANATLFFGLAGDAGLDFRMGVTDMNDTSVGVFASRQADSPTEDRWLLPTELATFQANVNDPSGPAAGDGGTEHGMTNGMNAVLRHLPRDDAQPARIREDAQLVVVFVTDEKPEELEDAGVFSDSDVNASASQLSDAISVLKDYIDVLQDAEARVHAIAVPPPYPSCSSGGEVGWGYTEVVDLFGGQYGSICQPDLGPTLDTILDEIVGDASPIVLDWVPISATISVVRDNVVVPRSRSAGWDYNANANSIVFYNLPFDPEAPAELVISYQRWTEQVIVD